MQKKLLIEEENIKWHYHQYQSIEATKVIKIQNKDASNPEGECLSKYLIEPELFCGVAILTAKTAIKKWVDKE